MKNKGLYNKQIISKYLWRNYLSFIVVAILLILVPCFILEFISNSTKDRIFSNIYTADSLMENNIEDIIIDEVLAKNGSVDIITEDYRVHHLGGAITFSQEQFSKEEFATFLLEANTYDATYKRSIAYNSREKFWLMVSFPISLRMEFIIQYNLNSPEFPFYYKVVLASLAGYFILVVVSAFFFAKYNSKTLMYMEESRKRLVRDIAHDLKNPLASIQGNAELYQNNIEAEQGQKEHYVDIIHRNSVRANELITMLFEYSKLDSIDFALNIEKADICELLRLKLAYFFGIFEEQHIDVLVEIPEMECLVPMDYQQMNRVFDNLFENILKYSKSATQVRIALEKQSKYIQIIVEDDGEGMDEETAKHCFEPFFREDKARNSQTGGTGLGLAIVQKIIQAHHGKIQVETEKGEGCRFMIQFPGK